MEYCLREIFPDNEPRINQLDTLLEKEGIQRDRNLDYIVGLFDEEDRLVATGACFANTLRCMAVDSALQGQGLLNQVMGALVNYQCHCGNTDLFLYTKCDTAFFFSAAWFLRNCQSRRTGRLYGESQG